MDKTEIGRRGFLGRLAIALGALAGAIPLLPGIGYLLAPAFRRPRAADLLTVGRETQFTAGRPARVTLYGTRFDAWTRHDREKLGDLTRQMVEPLMRRVLATRWLTVEYFVCSAVDSSKSRDYPELEVLPLDDRHRQEAQTRAVKVSPVPARWPKTWQAGEFFYPRFAPISPDRVDVPPAHIGLNRVAEFLLDL